MILVLLANIRTQHLEQYLTWEVVQAILWVQPLILLTAVLVAMRIRILVSPPGVSFLLALKAILLGVGLNVALPGRISELLKPAYLHEHGKVPFSVGLAAVFVERVTDFITMGFLAVLAMGIILNDGTFVWVFPVTLALLGLPLVSHFEGGLVRVAGRIPGKLVRSLLVVFVAELAARLRERVMFRAIGLGVLAWGATFSALYALVEIAGTHHLTIPQAAFLVLAVSVGGAAAVFPGGFGSYEAVGILVLQRFGYSFEEALVLSLAMHVTQLLPNVIGAVWILFREKLGLATLAREAREHMRQTRLSAQSVPSAQSPP